MLSEQNRRFISEHMVDDTAELLLHRDRFPGINVPLAVTQIEGRRKAIHKLPSLANNPDFVFPPKLNLEQASSELTAEYKSCNFVEGNIVIDITGGLGIDSIYFAKRAKKVFYIEQNPELFEVAKYNFEVLGINNIECICANSEEILQNWCYTADLIYADPARRDQNNRKMVSFADCTPDIVSFLPRLFRIAPQVLIKASPMLDITQARRELQKVVSTTVVAVKNECRELLFCCCNVDKEQHSTTCVNILANDICQIFNPTPGELLAKPSLAPLPMRYIYDPNVAIAKAMLSNAVAERFGLSILHSRSRFATSDTLFRDYPGRIFELCGIKQLSDRDIVKEFPEGQANVICRNFPQTADQLRKQLRLREGGNGFLIATTVGDNQKIGIICKKVK